MSHRRLKQTFIPMSSIVLRFLAEPSTVNFGGKVHGGTVMKWIDEAGYACATSWSKRYCVTVFIGSIRFHRPIRIGELEAGRGIKSAAKGKGEAEAVRYSGRLRFQP